MNTLYISMFQGLLVALQNASEKSLIVVFTDNGSKDLKLEKEINRLAPDKCRVRVLYIYSIISFVFYMA